MAPVTAAMRPPRNGPRLRQRSPASIEGGGATGPGPSAKRLATRTENRHGRSHIADRRVCMTGPRVSGTELMCGYDTLATMLPQPGREHRQEVPYFRDQQLTRQDSIRNSLPSVARRPCRGIPALAPPPDSSVLRVAQSDRHAVAGAPPWCPRRDFDRDGARTDRRGTLARVAERARESPGALGHGLLPPDRHHWLSVGPLGVSAPECGLLPPLSAVDAVGRGIARRPYAARRHHRLVSGIRRRDRLVVPPGRARAG